MPCRESKVNVEATEEKQKLQNHHSRAYNKTPTVTCVSHQVLVNLAKKYLNVKTGEKNRESLFTFSKLHFIDFILTIFSKK